MNQKPRPKRSNFRTFAEYRDAFLVWECRSSHQEAKSETNSTNQPQETNMINLHVLGRIATEASEDSFSGITLSGSAGAALRTAMAAQKEENEKSLGNALLEILRKQERIKNQERLNIRSARAREAEAKRHLVDIDRAFAYAQETDNYVPWAKLLGYGYLALGVSASEFQFLSKIPDGWIATKEEK